MQTPPSVTLILKPFYQKSLLPSSTGSAMNIAMFMAGPDLFCHERSTFAEGELAITNTEVIFVSSRKIESEQPALMFL